MNKIDVLMDELKQTLKEKILSLTVSGRFILI